MPLILNRSNASHLSTLLALTVIIAFTTKRSGQPVFAQSIWDRLLAVPQSPADPPMTESQGNFNLPIKTAGGQQLWTDFRNRDRYRVQQNALTTHWRLLDPANVRLAWGSKEQCLSELDRVHSAVMPVVSTKAADTLADTSTGSPQHIVVLLHGLMRTSGSMSSIEKALVAAGHDHPMSLSYASTRRGIGDHAVALREVLEDLPSHTTFSFVGHSMGNIVVRHLVGDLEQDGDPNGLLPRCQAMVMLGPPNNGASIARNMAKTGIYGWVTGKGGMELGPNFEELEKKLGTPPFPFAIVAGDLSHQTIQNPLTDGAGDFVVSTEEAALDGAKHFKTVPHLHSYLMDQEEIQQFVVEFLSQHIRK